MDYRTQDGDPIEMVRAWMWDLHQMGRHLSTQHAREVEQIARLVASTGGSMSETFNAARSVIKQPKAA